MKRYIPIALVLAFVLAVLGWGDYVQKQREQEAAQAAYEAQRHLVVYSDMPEAVNADLSAAFFERTGWRVQIQTRTGRQITGLMAAPSGTRPDVIIASEQILREQKQKGNLQAYASAETAAVPPSLKDGDSYWTGLWYNPMVFVINGAYYERHGLAVQTWDDLIRDPELALVFPDLAAMDMAGDFLCTFVEMKGADATGQYLRSVQHHVASYAKSMSADVRLVAAGEVNAGVVDGAMARQYSQDGAPIYIIYPKDGTSYWLTGAAVTQWCVDGEMAYAFMDWLYSGDVDVILRRNHIYLTYAAGTAPKVLDAKGDEIVLFPVKKEYTAEGRQALQDWWIKSVRFGKD